MKLKRESTECNALKEWKLSTCIFNILDKRIKFYSLNTNLLPPRPKTSFRHLKQGIQEFHRKYVLVTAEKASNNIVVVCRLHFINALKQELNGTKAYKETSTGEKTAFIAIQMICLISLLLMLRNAKTNFLRCIGYLSSTKTV